MDDTSDIDFRVDMGDTTDMNTVRLRQFVNSETRFLQETGFLCVAYPNTIATDMDFPAGNGTPK